MAHETKPASGGSTTFHDDSQLAQPESRSGAVVVGQRLGRFELERVLGRGGMGQVFVARDSESGERVALKTLARTKPADRARFKREFRSLADVDHPNLVHFGELVIAEDGPSYFTMEIVDGVPFTAWIRGDTPPGQLPDLDRLTRACTQLLTGVERLHGAGYIHRDLKPSNVLVTPEGRVVILDFGIISELEVGGVRERTGGLVGTPLYMAPEQAAEAAVSAATDLYAIGTMLYECLSGLLPFSGPALQVLVAKQEQPAPDPQVQVPDLPLALRECCLRLLERDPQLRLSVAEVRARLPSSPSPPARERHRVDLDAVAFVGREREMDELLAALDDVLERRQLVPIHVRGSSGHGKSALLRQFARRVRDGAVTPDPVILRGRCRERESLPYKGIDAIIEALASHLRALPEATLEALRPRYADALAHVFPTFVGLWPSQRASELGRQEARGLSWAAIRELLCRLADSHALVLILDDFQWTDGDSIELLRELLRRPEAPRALLVLSTRDTEDAEAKMAAVGALDGLRRLEIGPLPEADAARLAMTLLEAQVTPDPAGLLALRKRAAIIALRCVGSPFFIGQMARADADGLDSGVELDQLVVDRLGLLRGAARGALEVVAVAGGPIPQARVLELELGVDTNDVDELCRQGLLVRGERGERPVEVAHDRIREICLAELSPERRAELQWALGEALLAAARSGGGSLESMGAVVFAIVTHFAEGLGDPSSRSSTKRLELAELHRIAGQRSAKAGAWTLAERDFDRGLVLVAPWLDAAKTGREQDEGLRELCLALAFGRAEALTMAEAGAGAADEAFDELIQWSLSQVEIGQIVSRRVALLAWLNRLDESLDFGFANLPRLGLSISRDPSQLAGGVELLRAWMALGRRSLDELLALPGMDDPGARAQLDVLLELSFVASYRQPNLMLTLTGIAVRQIGRHGYHPGLMRALVQLALALNALGKSRTAGELCDRALAVGERRELGPTEMVRARIQAEVMVWPASRSVRTLLINVEARYNEACDLGRTFDADILAIAVGFYMFEIDRPVLEIGALFDRFEQRNPEYGHAVNRPALALIRRNIQTLREGLAPVSQAELQDAIPFMRYLGRSLELSAAMMFADYEHGTQLMDTTPKDFDEALLGVLQIPRYAMHCALLEARRCPAGGRGRVRSLRSIRRYLGKVQHWAEQGPANCGPMAALVRGELAALRGRDDDAHVAYSEAKRGALDNSASNLLALAHRRLAALAARRGEHEQAEAALAEAIHVYEAWGALAVAARLRERGLAGA